MNNNKSETYGINKTKTNRNGIGLVEAAGEYALGNGLGRLDVVDDDGGLCGDGSGSGGGGCGRLVEVGCDLVLLVVRLLNIRGSG